jgi:ribulose 1,5-bisphosphate synthetase/thiazole synthase
MRLIYFLFCYSRDANGNSIKILRKQGFMKQKVTVVGAGNVGATAAQRLAEKELADVRGKMAVMLKNIEP